MTRTLPWLKNQVSSQTPGHDRKGSARNRTRVLEALEEDIPLPTTPHRRKRLATHERTPSTSPPPEPPQEEFMVEGLDHDDIYIMVEDEFNAVAKTFTQHLHHAEYIRLKNLAKTRNASTIHDVSRPVDTTTLMSSEVKKHLAAKVKSKAQQKTLEEMIGLTGNAKRQDQNSDNEEDRDGDPWVGTSLQGLMTSPRKAQRLLSEIATVKSSTKAAAGFIRNETDMSQSESLKAQKSVFGTSQKLEVPEEVSTESEDDDDDLDAPVYKTLTRPNSSNTRQVKHETENFRPFKHSSPSLSRGHRPPYDDDLNDTPPAAKIKLESPYQDSLKTQSPSPLSIRKGKNNSSLPPTYPEDIPRASRLPTATAERIKRRLTDVKTENAQGGNERDAKRRRALLNEIPTFLN